MAKQMEVTINDDPKHGKVTFIIEHGVAQSFSRSIRPKFNAAYRDWVFRTGSFRANPTVSSDFGGAYTRDTEDLPYAERRCISVFYVTL